MTQSDRPSDFLATVAREYVWLYDHQHGASISEIAAREGVPEHRVLIGMATARFNAGMPYDDLIADEHRKSLEVAIQRLNPFEAWVIRERYGIGLAPNPDLQAYYHRTYEELAQDCGLSRHRVHQVEQVALEKLKDILASVPTAPTP